MFRRPFADSSNLTDHVVLFLCGDVMTGRGIDQVLPHPNDPRLHEVYLRSAVGYVRLAEEANGPIPRPVDLRYIWGDALPEIERVGPDARIVNLETAVTTSDAYWDKGINYRMHPANVPCLTVAQLDCCVLANNHVLDWGHEGLLETLRTLRSVGLRSTGAGADAAEAARPAVLDCGAKGRVLVYAAATESSGVPLEWAATAERAGLHRLPDLSDATVEHIKEQIARVRRPGDLVVYSLHWGGNWGYAIPEAHRRFAAALIDQAGVDLIHGHSAHHALGIEVHHGKLVLYGCGDFINDYEGIGGYESYRPDLSLMYFPSLDPTSGRLVSLQITPLRMRRFQLHRATEADTRWLRDRLNREGEALGTRVREAAHGSLTLRWA